MCHVLSGSRKRCAGRRPVLVRALSDDSEGEETDDSDDEDMEEPVDVTEVHHGLGEGLMSSNGDLTK